MPGVEVEIVANVALAITSALRMRSSRLSGAHPATSDTSPGTSTTTISSNSVVASVPGVSGSLPSTVVVVTASPAFLDRSAFASYRAAPLIAAVSRSGVVGVGGASKALETLSSEAGAVFSVWSEQAAINTASVSAAGIIHRLAASMRFMADTAYRCIVYIKFTIARTLIGLPVKRVHGIHIIGSRRGWG